MPSYLAKIGNWLITRTTQADVTQWEIEMKRKFLQQNVWVLGIPLRTWRNVPKNSVPFGHSYPGRRFGSAFKREIPCENQEGESTVTSLIFLTNMAHLCTFINTFTINVTVLLNSLLLWRNVDQTVRRWNVLKFQVQYTLYLTIWYKLNTTRISIKVKFQLTTFLTFNKIKMSTKLSLRISFGYKLILALHYSIRR